MWEMQILSTQGREGAQSADAPSSPETNSDAASSPTAPITATSVDAQHDSTSRPTSSPTNPATHKTQGTILQTVTSTLGSRKRPLLPGGRPLMSPTKRTVMSLLARARAAQNKESLQSSPSIVGPPHPQQSAPLIQTTLQLPAGALQPGNQAAQVGAQVSQLQLAAQSVSPHATASQRQSIIPPHTQHQVLSPAIHGLLHAQIVACDEASISAAVTMSAPIVKTRYGALKGTVVQNIEGGEYLAFNGIPYAEPPVGQLRFKEPQPPKAWSGIRDARKEGSAALQVDIMRPTSEVIGSEDCLYLNVSTNSLSGKKAVMVWIHGGAFAMGTGSSEMYSPDYLLKHDIVFVSIYYRLHVLGFLNLDDVEAAGNQGLKDQVAALKWVQENIESFGGDPQNVTIFGESAGSASVHFLTLSPLAKGLFHKAIGQSGSVLNTWAYSRDNKESGLRLAAFLGLETTDAKEAVQFLRTVDAKTLTEGVVELTGGLGEFTVNVLFVPTTDDKSENPFAPQPAAEMAKKGIEVPSIFGYNSHEGILFLAGSTDKTYSKVENDFDAVFGKVTVNQDIPKTDDVVKSVKKYYFGEEPITTEQRDNYVEILGDLHFVYGIRRVIDIQSQKRVPMYLYKFSALCENFSMISIFKLDVKGTCHADDIGCLFYSPLFNNTLEPNSKARIMMERFTKLWTNFAKTGDPTPKLDDVITEKWLPVTKQEVNYLEISDDLVPGVNPDEEKWQFWKSISESA